MRSILVSILSLCVLIAFGQEVRRVKVAPEALFSFDPISGRYVKNSLPSVATYIEAWREQGEVEILVSLARLSRGYTIYNKLGDSTLLPRVSEYLGAQKVATDTTGLNSDKIYDFPQSRTFNEFFATDVERIKHFYSTPLRKFVDRQEFNPYASGDFSGLMHDFQLTVSGADLSVFAPPRLDAALPAEIYISSIFSLFYFDNQLVVVELTGREIKKMLEDIYGARFYVLKNEQSDLLRSTLPPSMHASLAGAPFEVNLTRPPGSRIEGLRLDDKPNYRVVMNSFAAQRLGKAIVEIGDYKTLLIKYLKSEKLIENREQWRLKPERWVREIEARERIENGWQNVDN